VGMSEKWPLHQGLSGIHNCYKSPKNSSMAFSSMFKILQVSNLNSSIVAM